MSKPPRAPAPPLQTTVQVAAPEKIEMLSPSGDVQVVRASQAGTLSALGYQPMTPEIRAELEDRGRYGGTLGAVGAGALGFARGATLGLSDLAIRGGEQAGLLPGGTVEDVRKLQEFNPDESLAGELASFALPVVGAIGSLGKIGRAAATAGALQSGVAKVGETLGSAAAKIAGEKIGGIVGSGLNMAAQGAVFQAARNISEQSLANQDLTVESVLADVGPAAILGGGIGAGLPLAMRAGKYLARKGLEFAPVEWSMGQAAKQTTEFLDPQRSRQLFTGAMQKELDATTGERFQRAVRNLGDDGLYARGNVDLDPLTGQLLATGEGKLPTQEIVMQRLKALNPKVSGAMDDVLSRADDAAERAGVRPSVAQWEEADSDALLDRIVRWRKSRAISEVEETALLERVADIQGGVAEAGGSIAALRKLKQGIDTKVKWKVARNLSDEMNELNTDLRFMVSDKIKAALGELEEAGVVTAGETERWTNLNRLASDMITVRAPLSKAIARSQSNVNILGLRFRDIGIGAIGEGVLGGGAGVGIAAANKALQTDRGLLFRAEVGSKLQTLGWLQKATEVAEKNIAKSMSTFLGRVNTDAAASAAARLIDRPAVMLTSDERRRQKDGTAPSIETATPAQRSGSRSAWWSKISQDLSLVAMDPGTFAEQQRAELDGLAEHAPQVSDALVAKQLQVYSYLTNVMPKNPGNPMNVLATKWTPPDYQVDRFRDVVRAAREPMTVLDDLQRGTLTREQTKAVQTLYPNLYQTMLAQVQASVSQPGAEVPYEKRLRLGILFPGTEQSLSGSFIARMSTPESQQSAPSYRPAGASKTNQASKFATKTERLESRQ